MCQPGDANILNNDRIDIRSRNLFDRFGSRINFVIKNQRIESDKAFDATPMQRPHDFGQFADLKTNLCSGRKVLQPKVDRIGPSLDRGLQLRPTPSGAHEFRFARHDRLTFGGRY